MAGQIEFDDLKLLKPEPMARALMLMAGKNPRADALIMQIQAVARDNRKALALAGGDVAKAAAFVERAKEVDRHLRHRTATMVAGFDVSGDYVGFLPALAAALVPALPKAVQAGVKLLGKAKEGDKGAAERVKAIKKGADAGNADMATALSVLKQADAVRQAVAGPNYSAATGDAQGLAYAKQLTEFFHKLMERGYSLTPPPPQPPPPEPMPIQLVPALQAPQPSRGGGLLSSFLRPNQNYLRGI
jgi:hypothetical protein